MERQSHVLVVGGTVCQVPGGQAQRRSQADADLQGLAGATQHQSVFVGRPQKKTGGMLHCAVTSSSRDLAFAEITLDPSWAAYRSKNNHALRPDGLNVI